MNVKVHILNASGNLSPCKNVLQKTAMSVIGKVSRKIVLQNVDIVIKESVNPEYLQDVDGVGGYCPSENFVEISIDYSHPSFQKNTKKIIERTLSHELHHAIRRQAGVKIFGKSLLESMFSEGLADYFAYEITGDFPIWSISLSEKDKEKLMKKAIKNFNQKMTYADYENWFTTGSKKLQLPRWTGYALGLDMVKKYLQNNPTKSVSSVINSSVEKLKL
ncbi:MAG: hypothetical protein KAI57_03365 [Candidatus Pacebacteria bacterium]|nr:hypothetical protein [Candidatus Paceibacterota bacterium]